MVQCVHAYRSMPPTEISAILTIARTMMTTISPMVENITVCFNIGMYDVYKCVHPFVHNFALDS